MKMPTAQDKIQPSNPQMGLDKNLSILQNQKPPSRSLKLKTIHEKEIAEQNSQLNLNEINAFLALKKLRQTEEHIKKIRGRFKVLKIKQQSFRAKTIHHQNLLKMNEQAQKYKSQHKAEIFKSYKAREEQCSFMKEKNLKLKEQIRQKNLQVRESMVKQKQQENKKIRQQGIQNDKKYKQIKLQDKQQKMEKRNKIVHEQIQIKQRIERYKQSRIHQNKQYKTLDMNSILSKNSIKEQELQQLIKIQQKLEKEHSNSLTASRTLKIKLQLVIQRRKNQKSQNDGRLSNSSKLGSRLPQINGKINASSVSQQTQTQKAQILS